jgi:hypothetical protein
MPQEPQGFMPQEEAAPMQQEMAAPMPQGFATGGGVQSDVSVPLFQTLNALQGVFGKSQQKTAQAPKRKKVAAVAQPRGRQNVARPKLPQQQPKLPGQQPTAGIATPLSVGAPKYAALGGFVSRSADGSKKKFNEGGFLAGLEDGNSVTDEDILNLKIPEEDEFNPKATMHIDELLEDRYAKERKEAAEEYGGFSYRLNNPGNVESNQDWAGAIGTYANERLHEKGKSPFAVFSHPVLGIRALAMDFRTKIKRHKGNIEKIIKQYAPESENKTQNYINFIQSEIKNKNKNKTGTTVTEKDLPALVKAVIKFENTKADKDYYMKNPEWIEEGIELSKKSIPGTLKTLEEVREYIYPTLEEGGFQYPPIPKEKPKKMEGGFVSA